MHSRVRARSDDYPDPGCTIEASFSNVPAASTKQFIPSSAQPGEIRNRGPAHKAGGGSHGKAKKSHDPSLADFFET
jgi:hypothetical protein